MALIASAHSLTNQARFGARSLLDRRSERRALAQLSHYPARLLCDMGLEPDAVPANSWDFRLGQIQAIGNRP